ncbi:MAG: RdgB/HAM1 family non-canonical purine NTP pyrophosphatase [Bdellovibrionales bacterium]|jgi:XTP/dITP diphosphohydrolase|nr:RdgB/HAM1 family non-canonical purine NTP pyrophosphatase [Bdellovibrionales bacterium]
MPIHILRADNDESPPRVFSGDEIVFATHNAGKVKEIRDLLGARVQNITIAADHGLESPAETGTTFVENALIKARYVAEKTGKVALADDSGICMKALDGAPGVYAADWAEKPDGTRDFGMAMQKAHDDAVEKHGSWDNAPKEAYFVSCLVLAWPDGHAEAVEGHAHGTLVWPPRGEEGFGYDPMFVPQNDTRTYGDMPPADKKKTSHRAEAFRLLIERCFTP